MKRNCEICGSKKYDLLHKQKFVLEKNYLFSYNVVACQNCGFIFASKLPTPKKLEKFYKENIKYAYQHQYGNSPNYIQKFHLDSFKMVDSYLKYHYPKLNRTTLRILDIGCATGYLLFVFKKNQYKNLLGIDPSAECSILAEKLYNIRVLPLTLSEYQPKEKFDLIILASVMEHMSELENNLLKASSLLKENGTMFISVPDGDNFGRILHEPFLEFSLEHINYFTKNSLKNLLSKYGLENIEFNSFAVDVYGGYALNSLWKKSGQKNSFIFDKAGKRNVISYIKKSSRKLILINNKIKKLVKSKEKIIIWGVGSLTSRLLATTDLKKTNIEFFVDSNVNQQGKIVNNLQVKSPEVLKKQKTTVLVSTYIFRKEIKKILLSKYNFKGKIILL